MRKLVRAEVCAGYHAGYEQHGQDVDEQDLFDLLEGTAAWGSGGRRETW